MTLFFFSPPELLLDSQLQQRPDWRAWHRALTAFLHTRFSFSLWFLHVWRTPYSSPLCLPSSKTRRPQTDKGSLSWPLISTNRGTHFTESNNNNNLTRDPNTSFPAVLQIKIFVILLFTLASRRPLYNTKAHIISTAFLQSRDFCSPFPRSKLAPTIKRILPQAARVPRCNTPGSSFRVNWRCLEEIPSGGTDGEGDKLEEVRRGVGGGGKKERRQ